MNFKQCLKLRAAALKNVQKKYDVAMCPYVENRTGFTKHMYVKEHPRLVNEIPRGSKRYKEIKRMRSASERANSTLKEDIKILDKPRVMNLGRANILSHMAAIVLLLVRGFSFVVKTTCKLKLLRLGKMAIKDLLPHIPKSLLRLLQIQLE